MNTTRNILTLLKKMLNFGLVNFFHMASPHFIMKCGEVFNQQKIIGCFLGWEKFAFRMMVGKKVKGKQVVLIIEIEKGII